MRQDIDVSPLKTKVQEMKKQIKILKLQAELETKIKILELKAALEAKHVILEAQIRKTHSSSPKTLSITSTGRPESPGAKAVKDDKDHVFGKLLAKLARSAPHARSSNSTSNSPGLLGWLTGNILKAHGKNRSI